MRGPIHELGGTYLFLFLLAVSYTVVWDLLEQLTWHTLPFDHLLALTTLRRHIFEPQDMNDIDASYAVASDAIKD